MVKNFFLMGFLIIAESFFAQTFRNGPAGSLLDMSFSCYNVNANCQSLNSLSCSGTFGNWLFDPLYPPKICIDNGNALVGQYCTLEKTFEDDELVVNQSLRFFLTQIPSGINLISFMCANFGNSYGPDGELGAKIVVQIGTTKHFVDIPPFDPYVQWFPVEIALCTKNEVEEVIISLDLQDETESASLTVGIDSFRALKPDGMVCAEPCPECSSLVLKPNEDYILSAWVKQTKSINYDYEDIVASNYEDTFIMISYLSQELGGGYFYPEEFPSGEIIDGWQRIVMQFKTPETYTSDMKMSIELVNNSDYETFFDDIRIHPLKSNLKSFVYDQDTQKLLAELDENNYATFYEYDAEGGLVRVKKETEKGVFTIQETRSSNKKRPQE